MWLTDHIHHCNLGFCVLILSLHSIGYVLGSMMFSTCSHHCLIWTLELFCRMPWSSSFIFLTKLNVLMLWNLNWIPQGVSSLVLKSASYVHLGRLLIIKGLTTFFLWIFHCMKLLIKVNFDFIYVYLCLCVFHLYLYSCNQKANILMIYSFENSEELEAFCKIKAEKISEGKDV